MPSEKWEQDLGHGNWRNIVCRKMSIYCLMAGIEQLKVTKANL